MKMNSKVALTGNDIIQIALNIIAFLILYSTAGGTGSFWGFFTFNIIAGIVLVEVLLSKDKTAMWVWITKTTTYVLLVYKFSQNIGEIKTVNIWMICISVISLVISRRLIKKRAVSMWGQVLSYTIGGYMYIMAVYHSPESFGGGHIAFWLVNFVSYGLLIHEIVSKRKDKVNLIIPIFAFVTCLIYVALIVIF